MIEYPKIETPYERDLNGSKKLIEGLFRESCVAALANNDWRWTEKIDGTNIRIHWDGHRVEFGGRTDRANIPAHLVNRLNEIFGGETNEQVFEQLFGDKEVTLFGEGYGHKIQAVGDAYLPDRVDFALFDVLIGGLWLQWGAVEDIAKAFSIETVPVIGYGDLYEAIEWVKEGHESRLAACPMEGLVLRQPEGMLTRTGKRIMVKVKYRDFKEDHKC